MIKQLYKSLAIMIEKVVYVVSPEAFKIKKEIEYYQRVRSYNKSAYNALFKDNDFKEAQKHLYESYELIFERYRRSERAEKEKLKSELEDQSLLIDILNLGLNFIDTENA